MYVENNLFKKKVGKIIITVNFYMNKSCVLRKSNGQILIFFRLKRSDLPSLSVKKFLQISTSCSTYTEKFPKIIILSTFFFQLLTLGPVQFVNIFYQLVISAIFIYNLI